MHKLLSIKVIFQRFQSIRTNFWLLVHLIHTNERLHFNKMVYTSGYGRRDVVEYLLLAGASIQARDDGGLHPLHNACSFGHSDVVRLLLEAGANPNTRDNWNYTPLHEAAIKVYILYIGF